MTCLTPIPSSAIQRRGSMCCRATDVSVIDLTIEGGSASTAILHPGDAVTYTLTYANTGLGVVRDVVVTDTVPTLLTQAAFSASDITITQRTGTRYVWDVPDLEPGAAGQITVTGILSRTLYSGPITNVVTISTSSAESTIANNTASVTAWMNPYQVYLPTALRNSFGR